MNYKEVKKKAELYDSTLFATDPRFKREATLIHDDGSITKFDSAFLMKLADGNSHWILCFTEHHNFYVYHSDDLLLYWESERRREEIEDLE